VFQQSIKCRLWGEEGGEEGGERGVCLTASAVCGSVIALHMKTFIFVPYISISLMYIKSCGHQFWESSGADSVEKAEARL
jgi:hypothetical protein